MIDCVYFWGIEKAPVQQCVHKVMIMIMKMMMISNDNGKVDTQCYLSYVTAYTPATEEVNMMMMMMMMMMVMMKMMQVCSENYSKRCFIELSKKSVSETTESCNYPTQRVCSPPSDGEVRPLYV